MKRMPDNIKMCFSGLHTALITPFNKDKSIDFDAIRLLVDEQIREKVEGIVILGTTGENSTINDDESKKIIRFVVEIAKNKTKVIVGTGNNSTELTKSKSKQAESLGIGWNCNELATPFDLAEAINNYLNM